jgi:hypothetical protein
MMKPVAYNSLESHTIRVNGTVQTQENSVKIRGNKGTRSVVIRNGADIRKKTMKLSRKNIKKILNREFIPGLFDPCIKGCRKARSATKKRDQ